MKPIWWKLGVGLVLAGQGMLLGLAVNLSEPPSEVRFLLQSLVLASTLVVAALLGRPLAVGFGQALLRGRLTMEALFVTAIAGAMGASLQSYLTGRGPIYFEVVSILLVIYWLNNLLRARARSSAVAATRSWFDRLNVARLLDDDGRAKAVPAASIRVDDLVEVHPGESITIDGVIERGRAFVCEASLTGEPFAQARAVGDQVAAGSIVEDATLWLRATTPGNSRGIDGVLAAVEQARRTRISLQTQIDRWAQVFLPIVMLVALGTFVLWWFVSGWEQALFHAMSVLLVACPCALGLSAPLAIWATMSRLAKRGLVAHHADFVEQLAKVNHAVFDKTGTLTEDAATVADIKLAPDVSRHKLLSWLTAAERHSRHPVARALASMGSQESDLAATSQMRVHAHPGCGLEANFVDCFGQPRRLRAGTPEWIDPAPADYQRLNSSLCATHGDRIAVETDGTLAAVCLISERVRPSAGEAWSGCRKLGLEVTVLTGDHAERAVDAGFDHAHGRLSPLDKANLVEQWQHGGERCLFVGDGINDAAALGHATASIALASGAELAAANAQATLVSGDLTVVPWAVEISRQAIRLIRTNLIWAATYNAIGISVAASGHLHPIAAAVLMVGSSFIVIGRSIQFAETQATGGEPAAAPDLSKSAPAPLESEHELPSDTSVCGCQ